MIRNATRQGYLIACEGCGIDVSTRMKTHRGTVQYGICQTLKTEIEVGVTTDDGERDREDAESQST